MTARLRSWSCWGVAVDMPEPFADFIGFTVPVEESAGLAMELRPELEGLGMSLERNDERVQLWRSGGDGWGTVKQEVRGKVWAVGISGTVCAGLRVAGRLASLLAAVGARPHRVTRLDAAVDVREDAAPVVARITAAGRRGELALTRKRIAPTSVDTHLGLRVDGVESGTVYCGGKSADARMVVYDKRHERLSRKLPDVGNLTRYELRLRSGMGISLRDCIEPAAVFWHHAAPDFLPAPADAPAWVPAGEGFELTRLPPPSPAARMLALLERSPDVRQLLTLADQAGPFGLRMLVQRLEAMAQGGAASEV